MLYIIHFSKISILGWLGQLRNVDIHQNDIFFCHFAYLETEGNGCALMRPARLAIPAPLCDLFRMAVSGAG
ncbi:hypothetical protein [Sodalis-like endosymbiont of Proechinophthirus fluctus]|uniref:hypothetical protein n=1 Tax=Sodalis-like endosymbiont of Proechinophthirus fluctus TaxID=1462730 RepID=UPI001650666D|nr:hypothetical protein [Sodalis-like endosymbiont of Proechinophthirus fluctus]